jgi:hypothetical protein
MAITLYTTTPQKLLNDFKKKIDEGHIATWSYDKDGDFTHETNQWRNSAWLVPTIETGVALKFKFLGNSKVLTTWALYGIYQGRFIESMVTHCHDLFTNGSATAKPTNADVCTSKVDA